MNEMIAGNGVEADAAEMMNIIARAQAVLRYHLHCAGTEQIPYLDWGVADLLRQMEKVTGVASSRPRG